MPPDLLAAKQPLPHHPNTLMRCMLDSLVDGAVGQADLDDPSRLGCLLEAYSAALPANPSSNLQVQKEKLALLSEAFREAGFACEYANVDAFTRLWMRCQELMLFCEDRNANHVGVHRLSFIHEANVEAKVATIVREAAPQIPQFRESTLAPQTLADMVIYGYGIEQRLTTVREILEARFCIDALLDEESLKDHARLQALSRPDNWARAVASQGGEVRQALLALCSLEGQDRTSIALGALEVLQHCGDADPAVAQKVFALALKDVEGSNPIRAKAIHMLPEFLTADGTIEVVTQLLSDPRREIQALTVKELSAGVPDRGLTAHLMRLVLDYANRPADASGGIDSDLAANCIRLLPFDPGVLSGLWGRSESVDAAIASWNPYAVGFEKLFERGRTASEFLPDFTQAIRRLDVPPEKLLPHLTSETVQTRRLTLGAINPERLTSSGLSKVREVLFTDPDAKTREDAFLVYNAAVDRVSRAQRSMLHPKSEILALARHAREGSEDQTLVALACLRMDLRVPQVLEFLLQVAAESPHQSTRHYAVSLLEEVSTCLCEDGFRSWKPSTSYPASESVYPEPKGNLARYQRMVQYLLGANEAQTCPNLTEKG